MSLPRLFHSYQANATIPDDIKTANNPKYSGFNLLLFVNWRMYFKVIGAAKTKAPVQTPTNKIVPASGITNSTTIATTSAEINKTTNGMYFQTFCLVS